MSGPAGDYAALRLALVCPVPCGEGGCGLQGGFGVVQQGGKRLEDVRNAGPDLEFHRDVVLRGAGGKTHRVVQQDLVRPDLDVQRGQSRQIREERAGERRAGIGSSEVVGGAGAQGVRGQGGVDIGLAGDAGAGQRQVGPGQEDYGQGWLGSPASLMATSAAMVSPPPATSTNAIFELGTPSSSRAR